MQFLASLIKEVISHPWGFPGRAETIGEEGFQGIALSHMQNS